MAHVEAGHMVEEGYSRSIIRFMIDMPLRRSLLILVAGGVGDNWMCHSFIIETTCYSFLLFCFSLFFGDNALSKLINQ